MTLLLTKLFRPKPPPAFTARLRLDARLDDALAGKLTLVNAGAGYGKTTTVSAWLEQRNEASAWLSLDEFDDDPERFFRYFVAAWQRLDGKIGRTAADLISSAQTGPFPSTPQTLLVSLINDLAAESTPYILVLDDWHLIKTQAICDLMRFWIEHTPPHIHTVLISRKLPDNWPLPRWRVRRQLAEINSSDLQFTHAETAEFFRSSVKIGLNNSAIARLLDKTEGWAASLQLAALTFENEADPAQAIDRFTGSHRYVVDYLVDEVLAQQSAEIQRFLSETCILDRLTPAACDAICDHTHSQLLLRNLHQRNLFVSSLDSRENSFRYHPLLSDLLRQQLAENDRALHKSLHERAFNFYAAQAAWDEAVKHGLAAETFGAVANMLNDRAHHAVWRDNQAERLFRWCEQLPQPILLQHTQLAFSFGWAMLMTSRRTHLQAYIPLLEAHVDVQQSPQIYAEWVSLQSEIALFNDDYANALDKLNAIDFAQLHDAPFYGLIRQVHGFANRLAGNITRSRNSLEIAHTLTTSNNTVLWLAVISDLIGVEIVAGNLHRADALYASVLARIPENQRMVFRMTPYVMIRASYTYLRRNRFAEAIETAQQAQSLMTAGYYGQVSVPMAKMVQAFATHGLGDQERATQLMRQATDLANRNQSARLVAESLLHAARLALLQNRQADVDAWAHAYENGAVEQLPRYVRHEAAVVYGQWLLVQDAAAAVDHLLPHVALARDEGWHDLLIDVQVLMALAYWTLKDRESAIAALREVLAFVSAENYLFPFTSVGSAMIPLLRYGLQQGLDGDAIGQIQSAFLPGTAPTTQPLVEPLTARELEILALIADGLSNPEIAQRLIIATGTVARHTNNIFGKLAVRNRTEATLAAKSLSLI